VSEHQPERGEGGRFLPRTAAPSRNPERQKLAEAIERLSALDGQLKRLAEARPRLDWGGKSRAVDAARAALAAAKERAPEVLVAKAMGEPFDPALTVEHAASLLADAERDLAEATEADKLLRDEITVVEERRERARNGRTDAVREVLRTAPEVVALCTRVEETRQRLHAATWALSAIGLGGLPAGYRWDGVLWGRDNGSGAPWRTAIAALERDPDAALPSEAEAQTGYSSDSGRATLS
jgi:hypothetical protein